jgi:hypothetical protein
MHCAHSWLDFTYTSHIKTHTIQIIKFSLSLSLSLIAMHCAHSWLDFTYTSHIKTPTIQIIKLSLSNTHHIRYISSAQMARPQARIRILRHVTAAHTAHAFRRGPEKCVTETGRNGYDHFGREGRYRCKGLFVCLSDMCIFNACVLVYTCVYVCIYIYMYIYIYIYIYTYIRRSRQTIYSKRMAPM